MFAYNVYMCATCMPGAHRGQKKGSDPPKLELQMIVGHHVGSRNWTLGPLEEQVLLTSELSIQPLHFLTISQPLPTVSLLASGNHYSTLLLRDHLLFWVSTYEWDHAVLPLSGLFSVCFFYRRSSLGLLESFNDSGYCSQEVQNLYLYEPLWSFMI